MARNFRQAAAKQQARINRLRTPESPKPALQLPLLKASLLTRLNPAETVALRVRATISRAPSQAARAASNSDALRPILAAPEFNQPMYEVLRDLSQELLLPGLGHVPPNTVTLLETNAKFVEAFMVGLNTGDGPRVAVARFSDRSAGHLFPAVLGRCAAGHRAD